MVNGISLKFIAQSLDKNFPVIWDQTKFSINEPPAIVTACPCLLTCEDKDGERTNMGTLEAHRIPGIIKLLVRSEGEGKGPAHRPPPVNFGLR